MSTPDLIPVALYYRWSSDDQQDSLDRQKREVAGYLPTKKYKVVATYTDEGKSASSVQDLAKREQFLKLLADSAKGQFRVVVCLNVARFGRLDSIDGAFAKQTLRAAGVILDTVQEGVIDWGTSEGRWKDMALSELASAYSRTLSRETISGRMRVIERKEWPNGDTPYGYDRLYTDGTTKHLIPRQQSFRKPRNWRRHLVTNEREAEVVRWLFTEFSTKSTSIRELTRQLVARKVPTPDGGLRNSKAVWCKETVRRILRCKAYIGVGYIGTHPVARPTKFERCPPTEVEGCCPAIVDRAAWDAVQRKIEDNREKARNNQPQRAGVLSGFLDCAHCGLRLRKTNGQHSRKGKNDYVCSTSREDPNCACKQWRVWEEEALPEVTTWLVKNVDFAILERMQARPEAEKIDDEAITERLIESIRQKITRGSANFLLADPELIPQLTEQLRAWRAELAEAEGCLSMIRATREGGDMAKFGKWWEGVRSSLVLVASAEWAWAGGGTITNAGGGCAVIDGYEQTRTGVVATPEVLREFFRQIDLRAKVRWVKNPKYRPGRGGGREYLPESFAISARLNFGDGNLSAADTRRRCR